jgi:hypothetical protein
MGGSRQELLILGSIRTCPLKERRSLQIRGAWVQTLSLQYQSYHHLKPVHFPTWIKHWTYTHNRPQVLSKIWPCLVSVRMEQPKVAPW